MKEKLSDLLQGIGWTVSGNHLVKKEYSLLLHEVFRNSIRPDDIIVVEVNLSKGNELIHSWEGKELGKLVELVEREVANG